MKRSYCLSTDLRGLGRHRHDHVEGELGPRPAGLVLGDAGKGAVVVQAGAGREEELALDGPAALLLLLHRTLNVVVVAHVDVVDES